MSAPVQSRQGGARVFFPPPFIFLGFLLVGVVLQRNVVPIYVPFPRSGLLVNAPVNQGVPVAIPRSSGQVDSSTA